MNENDIKLNIWWHGISDNNWGVDSYKDIMNVNTVSSYHESLNFLSNHVLPNSMIFIMRKGVDPVWEHPENKDGGCWSFKIDHNNGPSSLRRTCDLLIENNVFKNSCTVNGVSISPKKGYYIIKIWVKQHISQDDVIFSEEMENIGSKKNGLYKKN